MSREVRSLAPFSGGLNQIVHPGYLQDNELLEASNIDYTDSFGAITKRDGTTSYATLTGGDRYRITGMHWVQGATSFWAHDANGALWLIPVAGGVVASPLVTGLGTGRAHFANMITSTFIQNKNKTNGQDQWVTQSGNIVYMVDGGAPYRILNQATARTMGFPAPATTATVATGAAGVLTGNYQYRITFVYDNAAEESSGSSSSATVSPSAQQVDLTAIPVGGGSSGVTARNIYRTAAGGTVFYYLHQIADNATTTYSDNIADTSLGTEVVPNDNGVPPNGAENMVKIGDRIFMSLRNVLYFNAIVDNEASPFSLGSTYKHTSHPEIFPIFHRIVFDHNITGLISFQGNLLVFLEYGLYLVAGRLASEFVVIPITQEYGTSSPASIVEIDGAIYWLGRYPRPGIYRFGGGRPTLVSHKVHNEIEDDVRWVDADNAEAMKYKWNYVLFYPDATNNQNQSALVYDTRAQVWSKFDGDQASGNTFANPIMVENTASASDPIRYVAGEDRAVDGDEDTTLYRIMDESVSVDVGPTNIAMAVRTKHHDFGKPETQKRFIALRLVAEADANASIIIDRFYDYESSATGTTTVNLVAGFARNTETPIADGSSLAKRTVYFDKNEHGHTISVRVRSTDAYSPKILRMELEYEDIGELA